MEFIKNDIVTKLIKNLKHLNESLTIFALKSGTEVEFMDFNEIRFLKYIAHQTGIPLVIKIGGPEARNDIYQLKKIGVDTILAPMIESIYALNIFVNACNEIQYKNVVVNKAINIETITAYNALDSILETQAINEIDQITVGRGDLAASLNLGVDDEEVLRITSNIIKKARNKGIKTSIGGGVTPGNVSLLKNNIGPNRVNTRHVVINLEKDNNYSMLLNRILDWEMDLYSTLKILFPDKEIYYQSRIAKLVERNSKENYPAIKKRGKRNA